MSEEIREKKYKFESKIKLPDMQEILDAASDFTPPSEKKLEVETVEQAKDKEKKSIMELAHKPVLSPEQEELQRLGMAVADEEIRRAKEKERQRAEELRRLCREREELAKKKEEEDQKAAAEEMKKAIQAAKEKAQARKDAASAEEAEKEAQRQASQEEELSIDEQIDRMAYPDNGFKMPPIASSEPSAVNEEPAQDKSGSTEEETMVDISELAINPFEDRPIMKRMKEKEKEEFKETILENDYKEEMNLREDTSESVDEDFLDF